MKSKRTFVKIGAAVTAITVIAAGFSLWDVSGANAAVRDRIERFQSVRDTVEAVSAVLTDEQRAVLEAFRSESKDIRAERREFVGEQRALFADFELTAGQWDQLSGVADAHGQVVVDAAMKVAEGRAALRDATIAGDGGETQIRKAAESLGLALGEAAVAVNAAVADVRAVLTPEQQAAIQAVVETMSQRRDEKRYAIAERFLELRSALDLSGDQKAAIAGIVRDVLSSIPLDGAAGF